MIYEIVRHRLRIHHPVGFATILRKTEDGGDRLIYLYLKYRFAEQYLGKFTEMDEALEYGRAAMQEAVQARQQLFRVEPLDDLDEPAVALPKDLIEQCLAWRQQKQTWRQVTEQLADLGWPDQHPSTLKRLVLQKMRDK